MLNKYSFFGLEVMQAWIDRSIKDTSTLLHRSRGTFMAAHLAVFTQEIAPALAPAACPES